MHQQHHGEHVHVQARPTQHDAPSTSRDCHAVTETAQHVTIITMNKKCNRQAARQPHAHAPPAFDSSAIALLQRTTVTTLRYAQPLSLVVSVHFVAYATTQPAALYAAAAEGTPATNAADVAKKSLFCTSVTVVPSSVTSARASHRGVTHTSQYTPVHIHSDATATSMQGHPHEVHDRAAKHAAHRASAPRRLLRTGGPTGTP